MDIKKIVLYFIPPVIVNIFKYLKSKSLMSEQYGWNAGYTSFKEVIASSSGYDSDEILKKCSESLYKVKIGDAVYERDSVLLDTPQYSFPLLASLLWIASLQRNTLNLVDFGGSLGSSYFQNSFFLSHLNSLSWNIVEQGSFVSEGKRRFEDEYLKFFYNIKDCLAITKSNVLLFSNVIQYLENPFETVKSIIEEFPFEYVIFDITPFTDYNTSIITKQIVPPAIYTASYPCWIFNRKEFENILNENYELVYDFDGYINTNFKIHNFKKNGYEKGFLYRRKFT